MGAQLSNPNAASNRMVFSISTIISHGEDALFPACESANKIRGSVRPGLESFNYPSGLGADHVAG